MKNKLIYLITFLILLTSCGDKKEQVEKEVKPIIEKVEPAVEIPPAFLAQISPLPLVMDSPRA